MSKTVLGITNAKELLEESLKQSMASDYQFMVTDDLFSYQDDGRSERSYFKDDRQRKDRDR